MFLIWKQVLSPRQLVKELPSNNHSDTGGHYCVSLVLLCCRPMRIFYGTRTHRQISQITHELAKTAYSKTPLVCLSFSFCVCTCCVPVEIVITISRNTVISISLPSLSLSSPLHSSLPSSLILFLSEFPSLSPPSLLSLPLSYQYGYTGQSGSHVYPS